MTDYQPTGDDRDTDQAGNATNAQLAALALVRLCLRDEDAKLSVDLLTNQHGAIDVDVIQELVFLSTGLVQALAELLGADPEGLLDEQVRHLISQDEDGQESGA